MAHSVPVRGGAEQRDRRRPGRGAQRIRPTGQIRAYLQAHPLPGQPGLPQPLTPGQPDAPPIRAVLEAAAMTTRAMLDALPPGRLHATGGWSRSEGLLQLRASVLDRTILASEEPELALVGAALMAAEAAGAPADFHPQPRHCLCPHGATPMSPHGPLSRPPAISAEPCERTAYDCIAHSNPREDAGKSSSTTPPMW